MSARSPERVWRTSLTRRFGRCLVIGAILTFATNVHVQGVNLDIIGWILMIAGAAGLVLSFFQEAVWSERGRHREVAAEERREAAPDESPPRY